MRFFNRAWRLVPAFALATIVAGVPVAVFGNDDRGRFVARMSGFHENPAVFSQGSASVRLDLDRDSIDYELRYDNMTTPPTVAHLHFGEQAINGGVFVFLCGGGGKPACSPTGATSGVIRGTIVAADILSPAVGGISQGIPAGNLDAAKRIIADGAAYANIHSPTWLGGELRGQVGRN